MKLFIDTNTLFSSYFGPDSDWKSLQELEKMIKSKKVDLFFTEQIENEYLRNVASRIDQTRDSLNKLTFEFTCKPKLDDLDDDFRSKMEQDISKIKKDFERYKEKKINGFEEKLKVGIELIDRIFSSANKIGYSEAIIERAKLRHIKGNPPKKDNDNSYGDAINWESILEYGTNDDFVIITKDPDYLEKGSKGKMLNRVLVKEWKEKTKNKLTYHLSIGTFINDFEKKDLISKSTILKESYSIPVLDYSSNIVLGAIATLESIQVSRATAINSLVSNIPDLSYLSANIAPAFEFVQNFNVRIDELNNVFQVANKPLTDFLAKKVELEELIIPSIKIPTIDLLGKRIKDDKGK
jgi:hypothetical protein